MKSSLLHYKGYSGSIMYNEERDILWGKVLGIGSVILFEGNSLKELKEDFADAIDDYLALCEELCDAPEKPYKGTFNIRIGEKRHRFLDEEAKNQGKSINSLISDIIDKYIAQIA